MEEPLSATRTWLAGGDPVPVLDDASVSLVRERVRSEGARVGLDPIATAALVNVASEFAHNQLAHAAGGAVLVREAVRGGDRGLEVVAADGGPGIRDVAGALQGRAAPGGSLGVGLAAVCELADEVDVDVRREEGTCIWARKFSVGAPRRPRVGIYGRPYPGERVSGDDAAFVRSPGALLCCLADGLGHGPEAREASILGARRLAQASEQPPADLLASCDSMLARTRGAVMAIARIDDAGQLDIAGVGNVGAQACGIGSSWRFGGSSWVLGAPGGVKRIATERRTLPPRHVLVLYSDGIRSRADCGADPDLLREHPAVVAQRIVERFAREDDDALVMVVG